MSSYTCMCKLLCLSHLQLKEKPIIVIGRQRIFAGSKLVLFQGSNGDRLLGVTDIIFGYYRRLGDITTTVHMTTNALCVTYIK